jgi:putative transposase
MIRIKVMEAWKESHLQPAFAPGSKGAFIHASIRLRLSSEEQRIAPNTHRTTRIESPTDAPSPTPWPHAPPHHFDATSTFFVTASTYQKAPLFHDSTRLHLLHDSLLSHAHTHGWQLEAWAVFSNHYHFIARPVMAAKPDNSSPVTPLQHLLTQLHRTTATLLNQLDQTPGRKVWHNFWDKRLTFEKSYMARLNYVHQNPIKHRLVPNANQYPWCSAAWFERVAAPAWIKSVYAFKTDKLNIEDDY